MLMAV